jgi:uncharacterized protein
VADEAPLARPPRWGLGEAAAAFVAGTVLAVVLAGVVQAATGYRPGPGKSVPLSINAASLVGLWAGLGGGAVFASRRRGSGTLAGDFGFSLRWPADLGLGVVAGLASTYVLVPLLYLPFEQIFPSIRDGLNKPAKQDTAGVHGGLGITVLFLLLAVGAPIVEELFFRGLLQRSLARRFSPLVAIAGSAALFGLAHFELLQLPALVLFGIVLAVLADRTGRLGPGIVAHVTFNAATVLTLTLHR